MALLAGAWSDRHGRMFLILLPLSGFIVRDIIFIIISLIENINGDFILFEALQDLTGGLALMMLAAFAYLADLAEPKYRTTRFALLEFL